MNLTFDRGAHICHLFENPNEQKEVALGVLKAGLSRGDHCVHLTSEPSVDHPYADFQTGGIDVASERAKGSLEVVSAIDWYLESDFHSVTQARRLWRMIESSLELFDGVSLTADMRWTFEHLSTEELCHWEATANLVFENVEVCTVCQYDLGYHSPGEIYSALRTHPLVIYAGSARPNPYYEAPTILANEPYLNGSGANAKKVAAMLSTLRNGS